MDEKKEQKHYSLASTVCGVSRVPPCVSLLSYAHIWVAVAALFDRVTFKNWTLLFFSLTG